MLLPENFPYITAIHVHDCYAIKDLPIPFKNYKPFSHLILTGKNGSGKTSILRAMDDYLRSHIHWLQDFLQYDKKDNQSDSVGTKIFDVGHLVFSGAKKMQIAQGKIDIKNNEEDINFNEIIESLNEIIYTFLISKRNAGFVADVENPTKENDFFNQISQDNSSDYFIKKFKQYLVNQAVAVAFAKVANNNKEAEEREKFISSIQDLFRSVLEDKNLELIFNDKSYDFYLILSDGRRQDFNTLSDGFSAFVSILMDLLIRTDLIRKQVGDFSYHPCGIVLIDEPETHLHLELQYQVLPILTTFFPNIQFIVATHSPAVISSIKNATVFDLTKKDYEKEEVAGKSYSELMISHFGLENEFSPIADNIFDAINQVLKDHKDNKPVLKQKLQEILNENEKYLSAGMRLEIESMIIENS
jgi:predicted ATP-binding protein involved in virulence